MNCCPTIPVAPRTPTSIRLVACMFVSWKQKNPPPWYRADGCCGSS